MIIAWRSAHYSRKNQRPHECAVRAQSGGVYGRYSLNFNVGSLLI